MEHRGRFQAQGGRLERSSPSESWDDDRPLIAFTGHVLLSGLGNRIGDVEFKLRREAFHRAHDFVDRAQEGGGVGFAKKSFLVRGLRDATRVDIEVQSGLAFV